MKTAVSLYAAVLGPGFNRLAPALRDFHALQGRVSLSGEVVVRPPAGRMAGWLARCLGAPRRPASGPIRFLLEAGPSAEVWTRHFPGRTMSSRLRLQDGALVERLGAAELRFGLVERDGRLEMELQRMRFFGLPCPRWLRPRVRAIETGDARRLHFDVSASVPGLGLVASYQGYLDLDSCRMEPA
ncbi:DUF4166 domain-containing protein [Aquabacterium sp. A7-Y]|uniref:DUF4166 domain-containing protein n=1 Tax=Aquabacterium sp. A7-Y TaxID=1349605 RepID=UPI00223DECC6|nr:DUF4166 domain-containing protein [Aquabacterium sp. A7-Y]MCW7538169.1 DUF4166 domain-containing protein [Aquabacterium sp. A7-Y]